MTRSVIDPITRIEGHLRVEMEVNNGKVSQAWVSGGLFRGMELILEGHKPRDAAYISQRICGVCPVSHAHASCFAAEAAYGIKIPNAARIIRNIVEGSQFLHSHILWFYNLAGLDYVNPLNALSANAAKATETAVAAGTSTTDFVALKERLKAFATNGQLSIFSGNWFDTGEYMLTPEVDLIATAHYLEALNMQARASQISAIIGGKMPHVQTSIPGGTAWYPTEEKLDDVLFRATEIYNWVKNTLIPDTFIIGDAYKSTGFSFGAGCGQYIAWGVFDDPTQNNINRYLPAGVLDKKLNLTDPDEYKITEYTGHSYYASTTNVQPRNGVTDPQYPAGGYDVNSKYSWSKSPRYDGGVYEAGPMSRLLVAYMRALDEPNNTDLQFIKSNMDAMLVYFGGKPGDITPLQSTLGRTAVRNIETLYVAKKVVEWIKELVAAIKSGDVGLFKEPIQKTGEGSGMWEAPRGALYHYEKIKDDVIQKYQIIIPSTWNIGPRDASGTLGPMEQALVGCPVADVEKPINALRTVHSFDPCVACAVHISEPATGKHFETVTNPWGVR
jgi:[NiFe] hydrogenase large subunit